MESEDEDFEWPNTLPTYVRTQEEFEEDVVNFNLHWRIAYYVWLLDKNTNLNVELALFFPTSWKMRWNLKKNYPDRDILCRIIWEARFWVRSLTTDLHDKKLIRSPYELQLLSDYHDALVGSAKELLASSEVLNPEIVPYLIAWAAVKSPYEIEEARLQTKRQEILQLFSNMTSERQKAFDAYTFSLVKLKNLLDIYNLLNTTTLKNSWNDAMRDARFQRGEIQAIEAEYKLANGGKTLPKLELPLIPDAPWEPKPEVNPTPTKKAKFGKCIGCGIRAVGACAKCGTALYCGKACQIANWKTHAKQCKLHEGRSLHQGRTK